jgi:hypothetical protein
MKKIVCMVAILFASSLLISCGDDNHSQEQGGVSQNAAAEEKSPKDVVFDELQFFHNQAMAKMGKLKGYEDLAKLRIDSLSKLSDTGSKASKADYEKLLADLQRAQKGMNDWMDEFQPDKYADKDSLLQYYQDQKVTAEAMRNDIFSVIDSAKAKFEK